MNQADLKLMLLNATTLTVSMSHIETALKILLLVFSIGYTAQRWYLINKK